jgi:hypothetical protein
MRAIEADKLYKAFRDAKGCYTSCDKCKAMNCTIGDVLRTLPTIEAEPDNGWISVKDRLPDDKERYLICTEDGRIDIAYYQPIGDKFSDYEPFWQGSCRFTTYVTHWRTLPKPPKGE